MIYYNTQSYTANRRPITDTDNMDAVDGGSVIGCGECEITGMNDAKAENTSESHDTLLMKADSERTPEMFDNYGNSHGSRDRTKIYGNDQLGTQLEISSENETHIRDKSPTIFDGKTFLELVRG